MTIIRTFCCWNNVRSGSFACAIYTLLFYMFLLTGGAFHVHATTDIKGPFGVTLFLLVCSAFCVISSALLLVGLCVDSKTLLLPWIVSVGSTTSLDTLLSLYLLCEAKLNLQYSILFVIDFIVCILNVYCLLCVVSQYQEYVAGRGRAGEDRRQEIPVHYVAHGTQASAQTQKTESVDNYNSASNGYYLIAPSPSSTCDSRSHPSTELSVVSEDQSSTATGNNQEASQSQLKSSGDETECEELQKYHVPSENRDQHLNDNRESVYPSDDTDMNSNFADTDNLCEAGSK